MAPFFPILISRFCNYLVPARFFNNFRFSEFELKNGEEATLLSRDFVSMSPPTIPSGSKSEMFDENAASISISNFSLSADNSEYSSLESFESLLLLGKSNLKYIQNSNMKLYLLLFQCF